MSAACSARAHELSPILVRTEGGRIPGGRRAATRDVTYEEHYGARWEAFAVYLGGAAGGTGGKVEALAHALGASRMRTNLSKLDCRSIL